MSSSQHIPPIAEKKPQSLILHEDERIDEFYWLRERENPAVTAYLEAENAYTQKQLAHTKSFQQELFQEIKGRINEDDDSVPYKDNGYYYQTRFVKGGEYPIYLRR